jgi:hypothetical protein
LVELGKIETSITFESSKTSPTDTEEPTLEKKIQNEEEKRREVSREIKQKDQVDFSTTSIKGNQGKHR